MNTTKEILQENLTHLKDALKWLDRSFVICDKFDIQQLNAEGMDAFESFTSRFARVSDILFNKVFRSIYYLEQGENASWLDVTLFMEKKPSSIILTKPVLLKKPETISFMNTPFRPKPIIRCG